MRIIGMRINDKTKEYEHVHHSLYIHSHIQINTHNLKNWVGGGGGGRGAIDNLLSFSS